MGVHDLLRYTYITIRGLLFQVLSIFMLFAFVKTRDDCIYAGITVRR